jgi:hypothetical protein
MKKFACFSEILAQLSIFPFNHTASISLPELSQMGFLKKLPQVATHQG